MLVTSSFPRANWGEKTNVQKLISSKKSITVAYEFQTCQIETNHDAGGCVKYQI